MTWVVAATKPNAEMLAYAHLKQQRFVPYVPKVSVMRRHARRLEMVKRPLFPGYIFIQIDMEIGCWRSINGTFGIQYLLTNGGMPQSLKTGFVEALLAREENGVIPVCSEFVPGEIVQVCGGPFDEQIGEIISSDQSGRVRLLMKLLGGDIVSTIDFKKLQKVG